MPASLKDVALKSGVSFKTVSRVINGERHVSPATRERVLAAANALGYRTNHEARGLRRGRTQTLRLVVSARAERFLANPFQDEVLAGVVDAASSRRYAVLLELVRIGRGKDETPFAQRQTDGSIVLNSHVPFMLAPALKRSGEPAVVLANRNLGGGLGWIDADFEGGARCLAQHLISLGHRRIVHFTDDPGLLSSQGRRLGYEQALAEAGIEASPEMVVMTNGMREDGFAATERLIHQEREFTAILAVNDLTALGAIECLRRHGIRVPEDISVTGYDDIYVAQYVSPPLTTVHIPWYEMGAEAVALLIDAIEGNKPLTGQLFPVDLRVRGTTAVVP